MKISLFAYSKKGCETMEKVVSILEEKMLNCKTNACKCFTIERFCDEKHNLIEKPTENFYGKLFSESDALVFISSCGIAVRNIATHVRDKKTDPAVICIDELGNFAISLLSGHIGGANELTTEIAKGIGAVPVITTATDINHRFSVDTWATRKGYVIDSMKAAKAVSARILENEVYISADFSLGEELPAGLIKGEAGELGIFVGYHKNQPYDETLRIIPKNLHLGIGCRKDTPKEKIAFAVETVLAENNIDFRAVKDAASIDLKKDEAGLLKYCEEAGLQISFYTSQELAGVEGEFTPSEFVKSVTGVDNVCERAALLPSDKLIVRKTALDGVTVSIGAENMEVLF